MNFGEIPSNSVQSLRGYFDCSLKHSLKQQFNVRTCCYLEENRKDAEGVVEMGKEKMPRIVMFPDASTCGCLNWNELKLNKIKNLVS